MNVTETLNDGLKRAYTFTVTAAALEEAVERKLAEAQPEIALKGFRKGKVPMALLRKQFGPRLMGEAMQEAIDAVTRAHFETTGDRPAAQPRIELEGAESWQPGQNLTVKLSYEKLPEIGPFDFSSLSFERLLVRADNAAVDEALERLAAQAGSFVDKDDAAAEGDQIILDFNGTIDGAAFEGGSAVDFTLELGAGRFLPDFEKELLGVKAGESRTFSIRFPDDYGVKNLAGREAVFACTIKAVKSRSKAALDDSLAQRFGSESLEDLRARIRQSLEQEYAQAARTLLKRKLLDAFDQALDFPLPESLVEPEAATIAHELWHEAHPEVHGHDHEKIMPDEEHRRLARRRVKLGLFFAEIGRREGIEVSDDELRETLFAEARRYPGQERAFLEFARKTPSVVQNIRAQVFEEKVVDWILNKVSITDKPSTVEELKAAVAALDSDPVPAEAEHGASS